MRCSRLGAQSRCVGAGGCRDERRARRVHCGESSRGERSSLGALQALQGIAGGQQVSNGAPRGWISSDLEILKRLQATLGLLSGANGFHGSSSGAGNGVLPVTKSPAAADPSGSAEPKAPPASETAAPPEADEGKTEKVEELKREQVEVKGNSPSPEPNEAAEAHTSRQNSVGLL